MKKTIVILAVVYCAVCAPLKAEDTYGKPCSPDHIPEGVSAPGVDTIMRRVIDNAAKYQALLLGSEAEIYIKGRAEILKQNILMRLAHHLFPVNRRTKDMVFEMVIRTTYEAPNHCLHDIKAINGSAIPDRDKQQEFLFFLNAPTALDEEIVMPTGRKAFAYYVFDIMGVEEREGRAVYRIRFTPKQLSPKLITGDLYVVGGSWTIDKMDFSGRYSFADFSLAITFGQKSDYFNLPDAADLYLRYRILGNEAVSSYHADFTYKSVVWQQDEDEKRKKQRKSLDLTRYFKLSSDTVPIISDTAYWQEKRPLPLTTAEKRLYETSADPRVRDPDTSNITKYLKLTEKLTNSIRLNYKSTRVRYSGILNPFQLGYSKRNGISYKQRLRINKDLPNDRSLYFRPEIGYLFKRKELYYKAIAEWHYLPERLASVSATFGNGNQSYSSEMMKAINEQLKDSLFNFDDLNLQYFRHYYMEVTNRVELFHGFQLTTSLTYNRRIPVKRKPDKEVGDDVTELIYENYNDFTPSIGISYTPRQYYRMNGRRKEYIRSDYPTISAEMARAIPGVWNGVGDFGRIELDIHQMIPLSLLRRLSYHISGGTYTRQKSTYFADFRYFTRRNFPDSWDDQIGGVFNLLKSEWFNASDKYVQAHVMYQSPFILLQFLEKTASKHVFSERIYFSQLWTPALPNYMEIGYGLGNHIFNIAAFAGFDNFRYQSFGLKFAFELFN
ncbi:MAG: DUF5686 family protein [Tannerellaceae bacterium]|nr:DUF5686 family protein [Tannerellaceae bacterium]